jgi:CheY-like chemotaxis protein
VLRQIRADPTIRAVPVVILTSSNQPSDVRRAYALGANSYLVKPVDFDRFRELMTAAARYWLESNVAPPP